MSSQLFTSQPIMNYFFLYREINYNLHVLSIGLVHDKHAAMQTSSACITLASMHVWYLIKTYYNTINLHSHQVCTCSEPLRSHRIAAETMARVLILAIWRIR